MPPTPTSALEREDVGDVTVLRLHAPVLREDRPSDALFQQIYAVVESEGRSRIVLNCEKLEFLSSWVLGRIVGLMRRTRAAGGKLVICKPSRPVDELLRITHLADILDIVSDEAEAVRLFG